jgi:diaminohydroxyphosphoribosylaminopyrimidine deaminase / 5-amino-6-(5-phosphoribosylamino)uracil reductase
MTNFHDKMKLHGEPGVSGLRISPRALDVDQPGRSPNADGDDLVRCGRSHAHDPNGDSWAPIPRAFRGAEALPAPWHDLFGPLRAGGADGLVVVGQLGQSLDGRIATPNGHSHYINGLMGRTHLHRLRALVDAVVVGVGTAVADDPQLTVRLCAGPSPVRVVLDPRGRLSAGARLLVPDGTRRIVVTTPQAARRLPADIEIIAIEAPDRHIAPSTILASLAACGLRHILIEGGADTVSRFLAAGCLDRLHVMVAPIILGAGRSGLVLEPLERVDQAMRPPVRAYPLGDDVLFDCDLSAQRVPIGRANRST